MTGENAAPAEMPGVEEIARAIYERRNGHGCKPWSLLTKAHKEPYLGDAEAAHALFAPILAEKESLRRELHSLAVALHRKHYWHVKQWKPFDDALGLATQIDNMTAGLVPEARALAAEAAVLAVAPLVDSIVCYASTIDEHDGNRIAKLVNEAAAAIRAQGE